VHKIVEYIKQRGEFPFDSDEVIEELDKVLYYFDVYDQVNEEEKNLLKDDLLKIAFAEEDREIVHLAGLREIEISSSKEKQLKLFKYA